MKPLAGACVLYRRGRAFWFRLIELDPKRGSSTISARQWHTMKRYRLWEANRKRFLIPENWLEPEPRDDEARRLRDRVNRHLTDRQRNERDGFCMIRVEPVASFAALRQTRRKRRTVSVKSRRR